MANELRVFTEADIRILQGMLDQQRRVLTNTRGRPHFEQESQSPEVYVARAPVGGIPATISGVPGFARCATYQLLRTVPPSLIQASPEVDVYNLSTGGIPAETWALVARDKFGTWVVAGVIFASEDIGTGTGTGTGADSFDFVVRAVDTSPSYSGVHTIEFDESDGFLLSNPSPGVVRVDFVSDTGTGTSTLFDLTVRAADGTPSYSGVTVLEFDEADGFSVSNPSPGRARVDWVDPDPPAYPCTEITVQEVDLFCDDSNLNLYRRVVTLNVVAGCLTRSVGSWLFVKTVACCDDSCEATGTGTSGDSSCAGSPICCTLASALCSTLNGDFLLTFDGTGYWRYTTVPGAPFNIVASNVSGVWSIAVTCNYTSGSGVGVSETCNPTFQVVFPPFAINDNSCCSDINSTVSAILRPGSYCTSQTGTGTSEEPYWWCLSPSDDTGTGTFGGGTGTGTGMDNSNCYYLTTAAKSALMAVGWVLHAGPYVDLTSCLIACNLTSETGTGTTVAGTGTGGSVSNSCCPDGMPTHLVLTFVSGCDRVDQSQPLVWNGSLWATTPETVEGVSSYWEMFCSNGFFTINQYCDGNLAQSGASLLSCSPFDTGNFVMPTMQPCCETGVTTLRVTE